MDITDKLKEVEIPPEECGWKGDWKGSIIFCPGGAFQWLSPREGAPVARAFAKFGWKGYVLSYTVYDGSHPLGLTPMKEAAAAVREVREKGAGPVVLCGFSAGGYVAASLGVHYDDTATFPEEEQEMIRPDALILGYSVITAGPYLHEESIEMLLGKRSEMSEEEWKRAYDYFCLEKNVDENTPTTFLWHTAEDETVPVQNSLLFAESLARVHVPFELHVYPYGAHGLSLATKEVEEPEKNRYPNAHVAGWVKECGDWLDEFLKHYRP